jgi:hypothetical protein
MKAQAAPKPLQEYTKNSYNNNIFCGVLYNKKLPYKATA